MANQQKYYLTALGMINALGCSKDEIAPRLFAGDHCRLTPIEDLPTKGTVTVGLVGDELPPVGPEFMAERSRNTALLFAAYEQIEAPVRRAVQRYGPHRVGVVIGSSAQGTERGEAAYAELMETRHSPAGFSHTQQEHGAGPVALSQRAGSLGPAFGVGTACSSSANTFRSARQLLRLDMCDAVIVGGVDALCGMTVNGFNALGALSKTTSNPLSRNRDGITLGEGAALFLLCREGPGVELLGIGASSDAHHVSQPDPTGAGVQAAMTDALADANLKPSDIAYINLHGTGTAHNDAMEGPAVGRVFGTSVPCSSTKPLVGHTLGAAGAMEIGFCWLVLAQLGDRLALPPHRWDGQRDPQIPPLNLVPADTTIPAARPIACLSNSFAFGGNNCSVIIGASS